MQKSRIAVVGFGFMGQTHAKNILKNPEVELAAIVDKQPGNISDKLNQHSGNLTSDSLDEKEISSVAIYSSLEECLEVEKLDACVIALHTRLHYQYTKMALEAGVSVFVEKPFCLDVAEGEELIELAGTKNLLLMVGQVVRFMPPYQKLKNWIESEQFGKLKFLSLTRFSGIPAWGQWKEMQADFGASGGALFDLVIHDIDFVQWVLGLPDSITSTILPGKLSHYDYLNAMWKYNPGTIVKIEGGNIFHAAFPFQAGFSANFDNASVLYSSQSPENIIVTTDTETSLIPAGDAMEGFQAEMDYFIECLGKNSKPEICMPASALQSVKLCHQLARESSLNSRS